MAELRACNLCFSPLSYGELCWPDVKAILAGAELIKYDMGHLESLSELHEPGVTYLPVRWNSADLEEMVEMVMSGSAQQEANAKKARARFVAYLWMVGLSRTS